LQGGASAVLHVFERGEEEGAIANDPTAQAATEIVSSFLQFGNGAEGRDVESAIL